MPKQHGITTKEDEVRKNVRLGLQLDAFILSLSVFAYVGEILQENCGRQSQRMNGEEICGDILERVSFPRRR